MITSRNVLVLLAQGQHVYWLEVDPTAALQRRLGKSSQELGTTGGNDGCPDLCQVTVRGPEAGAEP
jgi:hypothetical protein